MFFKSKKNILVEEREWQRIEQEKQRIAQKLEEEQQRKQEEQMFSQYVVQYKEDEDVMKLVNALWTGVNSVGGGEQFVREMIQFLDHFSNPAEVKEMARMIIEFNKDMILLKASNVGYVHFDGEIYFSGRGYGKYEYKDYGFLPIESSIKQKAIVTVFLELFKEKTINMFATAGYNYISIKQEDVRVCEINHIDSESGHRLHDMGGVVDDRFFEYCRTHLIKIENYNIQEKNFHLIPSQANGHDIYINDGMKISFSNNRPSVALREL